MHDFRKLYPDEVIVLVRIGRCHVHVEYLTFVVVMVKTLRAVTKKLLFYGGGVRSESDLKVLADAGFDGAIISTAVHKGAIPLSLIQEGEFC